MAISISIRGSRDFADQHNAAAEHHRAADLVKDGAPTVSIVTSTPRPPVASRTPRAKLAVRRDNDAVGASSSIAFALSAERVAAMT